MKFLWNIHILISGRTQRNLHRLQRMRWVRGVNSQGNPSNGSRDTAEKVPCLKYPSLLTDRNQTCRV